MQFLQRCLEGGDIIQKIIPLLLAIFLVFSASGIVIGGQKEDRNNNSRMETIFTGEPQPVTVDESMLISNYTWAIMRYDHALPSENFGMIQAPTPSQGTILIPTNMMSIEVCRAALSVWRETKMETLKALDEYDAQRMLHTSNAFFNGRNEWHTESSFNFRKESANEMDALGDICFRADLVGECYSQASFNTAVLRLCGFSPEEVFTIGIQSYQGGHAVNIVKVEDQWYVFDSTYAPFVRIGLRPSLIFEIYFRPPITDYITLLENDKYLINFGTLFPQYYPNLADPYSNIDSETLIEIVGNIRPLFNYSSLGRAKWKIHSFMENATPNPWMKTTAVPYTAEDAEGNTIEEKAESLASLNKEFVINQIGGEIPNQYDKSLYGLGLLSVDYPQAYANAARLAAWTSQFGIKLDKPISLFDTLMASLWIRVTIINKQIAPADCVAYSDLLYLRHAGSTIDQAIMAYGTLRNMKKDSELWSSDDLYVLITEDNNGYLAVNINDDWKYLNFEGVKAINTESPNNIDMAFNEIEYLPDWIE